MVDGEDDRQRHRHLGCSQNDDEDGEELPLQVTGEKRENATKFRLAAFSTSSTPMSTETALRRLTIA